MIIGVVNMPGRNCYADQCIKTRFFALGIPLFPTSCFYKISNSLGIEVPLTWEDIMHAYAKVHFGILALVGMIWSSNMRGSNAAMKPVLLVLCVAMLGFCIYSWLLHSNSKKDETFNRKIFAKAFMYNMPPEYLPVKVQQSLFGELKKIYFSKFKKIDWDLDIERGEVTKSKFYLLYSLAYYQNTLAPSAKHEALFKKVATYLEKGTKLKPEPAQSENDSEQKSSSFKRANPGSKMTMEDALKMFENLEEKEDQPQTEGATKEKSYSKTAANQQSKTNTFASESIQMTSSDILKLHSAKERLNKQLLLVTAFIVIGFLIVAMITSNTSSLLPAFMICLVIYGVIASFVVLPEYLKINKDLKNRQKLKVKVRIKDLAQEDGTTYLVLRHNNYGIKKVTAPAEYYSTDLLNKELEIYVSKSSHVLLEIIRASY